MLSRSVSLTEGNKGPFALFYEYTVRVLHCKVTRKPVDLDRVDGLMLAGSQGRRGVRGGEN